jgi:glycosyltransferase involved in cell wall biosynthesis
LYPKISVVIPFYNCPYINQAIQSVLDQSYPNIEILVVSDGSTKFIKKIIPYMNKIKFIKKVNEGTAIALNTGIKHATGEYFAWLSSDDIFHPEKLMKQYELLMNIKGYFCHTSYTLINENNVIISTSFGQKVLSKIHLVNTLILGCVINRSSVLINMDILKKSGLFDESLKHLYAYDLWLRLLPVSDIHYLDEDLLYYRIHSDRVTKNHRDVIEEEVKFIHDKHKSKIMEVSKTFRE